MKPIPWRVQLGAVAAGYAMVFLVGAALVFERHIQYVNNPADAASYGAMYAFGDLLLGLFIGGLFLVPTLLLVLVIRKSETAYTRYSQTVLGFSLTAPICLGIFLIPPRKRGELVPGLVLYGSSAGFSDHYCRAGCQPVTGAICPCQATDLVCVAGRAGNSRLAGNTLLFFSGGPSRVMRQSRQSWIDATGCSVFAGI
jgi:hypothetical protein